ncbi:Tetratricopeptide repeat-containing protein [Mariprofundus ferrinatatus]|uniref:Tetratricopeptide repeat-containing protein n=1 Tax=Mariprofundus ferrinatatus TaxID=1921087 RepID=A0A2K8LDE1_9PROT|nr:tetratricopeptide repeat protein [Mariprofundus ferrinatatus]ATX82924.1 Tetratricopeptide repeat-containing protein [Mariprofundus ferrinatatus]
MHSASVIISTILAIFVLNTGICHAADERGVDDVRSFLTQGEVHRAINLTRTLLADTELNDDQRFELLLVLAESEEKLAAARKYNKAEVSIRAYQDLHKEYPQRFEAVKMHWKVAWLSWNQGRYDQANSALQTILLDYPYSQEAKKAALLHARYLIQRSKFQNARSVLLRYFGLSSDISDLEETEGFVWLAIIEEADGNSELAYKNMVDAYTHHPEVIEGDAYVYEVYIRLLSLYETTQVQYVHVKRFLKRYVSSPEALSVRLLQADILVEQGDAKGAETMYGILASRHGESAVGKKAYMRQLMLQSKGISDTAKLKVALQKFSRLVASNQLSEVETEATLYQARILARLGEGDAEYMTRATASYAIAASYESPSRFADAARSEGKELLGRHILNMLEKEQWLQAVVLWKRYPQIRPERSQQLAFGVAQAYIHLLDFVHAEEMLDRLYVEAGGSVWSHRIMLEKARLWAERRDQDGVIKIMQWLAKHEKTLYRQDLLLIVGSIQNTRGEASAASQTLANINPNDLTPELRKTYWLTRARINLNLKRWHTAAEAWKQLAAVSEGDKRWEYVIEQADALIQGMGYLDAETALLQVPESEQKAAWHYAMALCAQNTGRWNMAKEHLTLLSSPDSDPDYQLRARMLLAQEQAEQVKRQH